MMTFYFYYDFLLALGWSTYTAKFYVARCHRYALLIARLLSRDQTTGGCTGPQP